MVFRVYFRDKSVTFASPADNVGEQNLQLEAASDLTTAKIIKFLENNNRIAVIADNVQAAFERFASYFKHVTAAGGIVRNRDGQLLMIYRRGRWDLPKGHLEQGESIEQCAAREIAEETGVEGVHTVSHLCTTMHAYDLYGVWELKHTHWFLAESDTAADTVPQREEDIDEARWLTPAEASEKLKDSYPTIREVFSAFEKM